MKNEIPEDDIETSSDSLGGTKEENFISLRSFTPSWFIREQEELEIWSTRITAHDMLDMYEDPVFSFYRDRRPESNLYKDHSLAGLRDEFRYQNGQQIGKIFKKAGFLFAPSRRSLLMRVNTRKTRRPDKDVGYPAQPCIAFIREKRFCQLEEEINKEMERKRLNREQERMEALSAGLLEECAICLAVDCLHSDMASCQAGHRFCRRCVVTTVEGVLATGKEMVTCLGECDMEVEVDQLQSMVPPILLYKLLANKLILEMTDAQLQKLGSCPFCPYQIFIENMEEKLVTCLNPDCGKVSCRLCKLTNHLPLSCQDIDVSRKRVEEELTMSWVRQCWNCNVSFERVDGCCVMTCPICGSYTCYICRKPWGRNNEGIILNDHRFCRENFHYSNTERHETELNNTVQKIKGELKMEEEEAMKDLFKPGTSKQ